MCVLTCRKNTTNKWTREGQCRLRTHATCIFGATHPKARPLSLQGAPTRVAFHLVRGPRKGSKVRNPSVGGIPGALSSTSSTSGRIRTPRQRAAVLHSGLRISVAQRVQLVALLAQVISAEDIDARQVSAADSADYLVALCDLCAVLGAPLVSRAG